jgi:hypothetical protein
LSPEAQLEKSMNDAASANAVESSAVDRLSLSLRCRQLTIGSNGGIGAALAPRASSIGAEVVGVTPKKFLYAYF